MGFLWGRPPRRRRVSFLWGSHEILIFLANRHGHLGAQTSLGAGYRNTFCARIRACLPSLSSYSAWWFQCGHAALVSGKTIPVQRSVAPMGLMFVVTPIKRTASETSISLNHRTCPISRNP